MGTRKSRVRADTFIDDFFRMIARERGEPRELEFHAFLEMDMRFSEFYWEKRRAHKKGYCPDCETDAACEFIDGLDIATPHPITGISDYLHDFVKHRWRFDDSTGCWWILTPQKSS